MILIPSGNEAKYTNVFRNPQVIPSIGNGDLLLKSTGITYMIVKGCAIDARRKGLDGRETIRDRLTSMCKKTESGPLEDF